MKTVIHLAIAVAAAVAMNVAAYARVPSQMYCWIPDSEFPVVCEYEDEDDYRRSSSARPAPSLDIPHT